MQNAMRRLGAGAVFVLMLASCTTSLKPATQPAIASGRGTGHTAVTIADTNFLINGEVTSATKPAAGQLLNTRMAQAIFDDENATTVKYWAYPDTHTWDPQRNTDEFVAMLPTYAHHGVRLVTVGLQGGCPSNNPPCPGGAHDWNVSAFAADGSLKAAWMNRLRQVITAADRNGIVVMVQFFYHGQNQRVLKQSDAVNNITDWLVTGGYTNVLVETANECNAGFEAYSDCSNAANVIKQVQDRSGGKLKVAVSYTGGGHPSDDVIAQEDFVLLHGNGIDGAQLKALIDSTKNSASYKAHPKPIVVNEDSTSIDNMNASVAAGVSWGYLDTGKNNYQDGFQRPPVNWTISTDAKKAFFDNALKLAGSTITSLVYGGASTADYNDALTMIATLTDVWGNPLPGSALTFGLGAQTCSGVTGPGGDATCTLVPALAAGNTSISVSYAGNDQFQTATRTVPFVIAPEQTALAYRGDATLLNGIAGKLSAVLTKDGTSPLGGRIVNFTLGTGSAAQTCSGTTGADGLASCTPGLTQQPLSAISVAAAFAGDALYAPASTIGEVQVGTVSSGLTYTGPMTGDVNDAAALSAQLRAGEAAVSGAAVVFSLGLQHCSAQTDAHGVAGCSLTPNQDAGDSPLLVAFAGNDNVAASSVSVTFSVTKEETKLAYAGDTSLRNGAAGTMAATLSEDGGAPVTGRTVSFTIGSGSSAQSCATTTDATGKAACSIASVNQLVGAGAVTASFAGDARDKAASDQPVTEVLAATATTPPSPTPGLATTGQAKVVSPLMALMGGWLLLVAGVILLAMSPRRPGEPPRIIWRNRE